MIVFNEGTYYIGTTRFNKETWEQNEHWKQKHNFTGCIYGMGTLPQKRIPANVNMFVIEMNNSKNQIEGIGIIKNHYYCDKQEYNIYHDKNYNRYVFKGSIHINREKLIEQNERFVEILENILFKGKTHLKRGQGITLFPEKRLREHQEIFESELETILN